MTEYLVIIDGRVHSRWPRVGQALSVGHVAGSWGTWDVHKTSVPALPMNETYDLDWLYWVRVVVPQLLGAI